LRLSETINARRFEDMRTHSKNLTRIERPLAAALLSIAIAACAGSTASSSGATAASPAPSVSAEQAARQRAADSALRNDWANLAKYRGENARVGLAAAGEQRVVFYGNSITEGFAPRFPTLFPGKPYVGRGISGQTTPQMLVRFRQDVVALKPSVVVILAGTNDIAGNTGPSSLEMIEDNLAGMSEIARANGIRVVLSSVLPVYDYPWKPGRTPAPKIVTLNAWIRHYADSTGATYLDYHSAMKDARDGLPPELARDEVHPTDAGYRMMAPLAEAAIQAALRKGP
jgi:lysophospholipase L1-like esterase